jgi:hypothetical protein
MTTPSYMYGVYHIESNDSGLLTARLFFLKP